MTLAIAKMLVGMGAILLLLYLSIRLLRRTDLGRRHFSSDVGIRILSSKPIGPRQYISLVEIAGEILALGVSEGGIRVLTKIENKEFTEKMLAKGKGATEPSSSLHGLPGKGGFFKTGLLRNLHGK